MIQYLELLRQIKKKGVYKSPAREGMPGSQSLFGYQFRHDLSEGFPLLTTKKMFWKGIVVELLWFLRGDTNIKYLVDNGVNIWNEDAYNYYRKQYEHYEGTPYGEKYMKAFTLDEFVSIVKDPELRETFEYKTLGLGECGFQYGKVWRKWETNEGYGDIGYIDQIKNLIDGLKNNPESRRHIVTAIDPAHDKDLALYWCHALFQFNCRPLTRQKRLDWAFENTSIDPFDFGIGEGSRDSIFEEVLDSYKVPRYYLDCQLYQRSADAVLGVPFNIASYALLTHILAKICNMIPGEFIHTFGDVHIYDNHKEAVEEQLNRIPSRLGNLWIDTSICWEETVEDFNFTNLNYDDFEVMNYNPQPAIKAELSTGLKK